MKTFLDCIPCFVSQALRAGRMATDDQVVLKKLLDSVCCLVKDIPLECTPPEMALTVYEQIRSITGVDDPFREVKELHIEQALGLYPELKEKVKHSSDPLMTAVRIAIAGNVIDLGVGRAFDIKKDIDVILQQKFAVNHIEEFRHALKTSKEILYLGDNAGESVFDRLLIEGLKKHVTYAVRGRAVINDVTMDDALASGLGGIAAVVSSGSSAPGAVLHLCSSEFVELFNRADMVISKGQGNYEALSDPPRPVFFLLKAKCPVIARDLGVDENDIVLKYSAERDER